MRALRLIWMFFRLGALNEIAYRSNFVIQTVESLLSLLSSLVAIYLVFDHTPDLAGWTRDELLALLGIYYLMMGAIDLVIAPSLQRFMEDVRLGKLDYTLTKPEDAQLLVSVSEFHLWRLGELFLGVGLLWFALAKLSAAVSLVHAAAFVAALLAGGAIVYSFWIALATMSFWFLRIENLLMIFWSVYTAGRWPIGIYPGWLRITLTAVVPVAFAVTVPAEAVRGRLEAETLAGALVLAVVLVVLSRWFWRTGLKRYSGASA